MERLFRIQRKLLPDLIMVVEKRYNILKEIQHLQPIGRRILAEKLDESERSVRNELDFLKDIGLIHITSAGAVLTDEGKELLNELVDYIKVIKGISDLEAEVQKILGISQVLIVPGAYNPEYNKTELGRFAAGELKKILANRKDELTILAVTGGTTMAEVANTMTWDGENRQIIVIPGRGGLGEDVEIQANTIAATIAKKLGGTYRMLHVPDNLQETTLNSLCQEPQIKEVLDLLARANILVHGVGTAEEMAKRRGLSLSEINYLKEVGAVGEAFGFYFSEDGKIVYTTTSVGLKLDDLKRDDLLVIAIAEGEEKARAILSVVSPEYHDILITDEKTAREMLEIFHKR
ncbi:Cro/Cl family transcriptional regulator [Anoxybacter fermentans]|uniref:Cro/Cl family transcriptional regulator n=1 Tax=Anoxybacter fermentans TaxID=1323375 RepID=A0A3S9SVD9_9FIRM|nr:sugar-binding domain-containing protein [Anoxybacter fermentans]AZR72277.1 Cro/Cl family transcriptional regulator [Anoxybacter fermentans]